MPSYKQSFAWWSFFQPGIEPISLINTAAEIGYSGVEMIPEEYWPLVFDAGMTVVTINAGNSGGWNDLKNHQQMQDDLGPVLEKAQQNGIPVVLAFIGDRVTEISDEQALENSIIGLQGAKSMIEASGVLFTPELLNSKVDHIGYQCDHADWGFSLISQIDSPAIKLLFDIYHAQIMDGDIIRTIEENISLIGHFHTAGVPGRHDLDETQELYYPAICRVLDKCEYKGFLGQEFIPKGDVFTALRQAFCLCNG